MNNRVAVIGAGISGLSVSRILSEKGYSVTVYEESDGIGGLVRCSTEDGVLFHRVGGHVFNTKNLNVANWFWALFKEEDFFKARRNAKIWLNNQFVGYPIENYLYQLDKEVTKQIVYELIEQNGKTKNADNFKDFLLESFGVTLYDLYFKPYNYKIWKTDLSKVSLPWLDGKLPMPDFHDIILNNIYKEQDEKMVHSTFFYPKSGGSSFIANRIGEGLNIKLNFPISNISRCADSWSIEGEMYKHVIYTGDVRKLSELLQLEDESVQNNALKVGTLLSNGTSNALCYVDKYDLSWLYLPEICTESHRIIFTGNFSPLNNRDEKLTCTVEFSGILTEDEMRAELNKLPFGLKPLSFNTEKNSYVIQNHDTRSEIENLKVSLQPYNFSLLGRFAEWEYYNMDKAIEAAMKLVDSKF